MNNSTPEEQVVDIDWSSLSQDEKTELIVRQAVYNEFSKKLIHAAAIHGSDVRNLLISMMIVIVLDLFSVDGRNILLSLIGTQIFFTLFSKVISSAVTKQVEEVKKSYLEFLKTKLKKDT
jgi:diacylglycerol kinase